MRTICRRIQDRFVRKPREGPPRPRPKAPSIESELSLDPGREAQRRAREDLAVFARELRACHGFAATITLSYVPSIATHAPPVERSVSHRPRHPCTPVPLLAVLALPRCQTQPSTSATLRTTHEHDSDRTFAPSLARWPFGQPALQMIIRLGELCSEPLGLISMLRIASKQPRPKKRTPVTVHRFQ